MPQPITAKQSINDTNKSATLQIKEEQLNITKQWVQTGDVKIHKESFIEEKNFTVPVMREELVIEKEDLTSDKKEPTEVIRIPLSEEQVQFTKHKVNLEDVSIYKQHINGINHIEETLKREEATVKVSGFPHVKDNANTSKLK